jgi:hypothetical protein
MLEHPTFRPKVRSSSVAITPANHLQIFFTGKHARAGEEEPFPSPDNASKMRRSVENAEHVGMFKRPTFIIFTNPSLGLFAPRAGQHYRDEQRRRRSRYDRGTRLAALEEYDYDDYYSAEQDFQGPYTGQVIFTFSMLQIAHKMERLILLAAKSPLGPFFTNSRLLQSNIPSV